MRIYDLISFSVPSFFRLSTAQFLHSSIVVNYNKGNSVADYYFPRETKLAKILIAEDEAINRLYITSLLKKHNYEYLEVNNGPDALNLALSGEFDLFLLDLGLPRMDGLEISRRLRDEGSKIKIIAVTGRDSPEDREEMKEAGIRGVIGKPIQEYLFYQEIEALL